MTELEPTFHSRPSTQDEAAAERRYVARPRLVDAALHGMPAANDPVVADCAPTSDTGGIQVIAESSQDEAPPPLPPGNSETKVNTELLYPVASAYELDFLLRVGKVLYASAQRGHITMAIAMIRVNEEIDVKDVVNCCHSYLRETDVFAQSADDELAVIVTNVGKRHIAGIFERLSEQVAVTLKLDNAENVLKTGATIDLGVTFENMFHRACIALQATKDHSSDVVVQ
ncbi:MAG: hypothetical protein KTR32_14565 [Granulosicoccus sp.]|nr:hypothetical protein [Granulosicoccus sp.]